LSSSNLSDLVECSQEQWDIYKLDPEYDCSVRVPPRLSVISRVVSTPKPDTYSPQSFAKRPSPEKDSSPKKKPQTRRVSIDDSSDEEEEEDEDEVEDMVVDELPRFRRPGERSQKVRAKIDQQRKIRREKIALAEAKYEQNRAREEMMYEHSQSLPSTPRPQSKSVPPESITKRKG
jgi:hypothetical protein